MHFENPFANQAHAAGRLDAVAIGLVCYHVAADQQALRRYFIQPLGKPLITHDLT